MILKRYLKTKLLSYFFLINGSLVILYNLVEFIEKLMRQTTSTFGEIAVFIGLNVLPSFFDLMSLGTWLATCLLIWELHQTKEWENLKLIGLGPTKILPTLAIAGIILSTLSFTGKELAIYPILRSAEKYKMKRFKQNADKVIYNQWVKTEENNFLNFEILDLRNNEGKGLSILKMSPDHTLLGKIESEEFEIDPHKQTLTINTGSLVNLDKNHVEEIQNYILKIPELFLHLKMFQGTLSLRQQIENLMLAKNLSSHFPVNQETGKLLARLLSHLLPLLYVLLTLCLFFTTSLHPWIKWIAIAIPYPLILISTAVAEFMLQHNYNALVVTLPYLTIFTVIIACIYILKQSDKPLST